MLRNGFYKCVNYSPWKRLCSPLMKGRNGMNHVDRDFMILYNNILYLVILQYYMTFISKPMIIDKFNI